MTQSKHTPGPWAIREHNYGDVNGAHGVFGPDSPLPIVNCVYGDDLSQSDANANLIAAAPELLAACQMAVSRPENITPAQLMQLSADTRDALRAAIAKATGDA